MEVYRDSVHNGAWTTIALEVNRCVYRIDSVYAPVQPQARAPALESFFLHSIASISQHRISGGDWNCVENVEQDVFCPNGTYGNQGGARLAFLRLNSLLVDLWREKVQATDGFTRYDCGGLKSRIDRIYGSQSLAQKLQRTRVISTPAFTDHEALLVQFRSTATKCPSPYWRLNSSLLESPYCQQLVRTSFELWYAQRSPDEPLILWWLGWKQLIKERLKDYSQKVAAAKRATMKNLVSKVEVCEDFHDRQALKDALERHLLVRVERARIHAGAKRDQCGDTPTAAFFAQANGRAVKRRIACLTHQGSQIVQPAQIDTALTAFWGEVFGQHLPAIAPPLQGERAVATANSLNRIKRVLSVAQHAAVDTVIESAEVTESMQRGSPDTAPGVDGLPRSFYIKFWDLFCEPLTVLARSVQAGEQLPQEFNEGVVALLPKTEAEAPQVGHFRPITLLNLDYKILAGVIATRIKVTLPSLVHETQTGFVPARQIFENISFNRDLIDWSKHSNKKAYLAFLDFEKAFDRVDWRFRDAVLQRMGFPISLIGMINSLYHNASVRLNINGKLSPMIRQGRGVRQGCPMSPFIFALFVEPLGELLRDHAAEFGVMLPLTRSGLSTAHILGSQFADDTTLYVREAAAVETVMNLIDGEFCLAAGAQLNRLKSRVLCTLDDNSQLPVAQQALKLVGTEWVKSLGKVYSPELQPDEQFSKVLEKMRNRLKVWQSRCKSLMARVLVSNAILVSCLWFFAYFVIPTQAQLKQFDGIVWGMLWGTTPGETNTRGKVKRERMTAQRSHGGLNILLPSFMVPAIQANMVNRAINERGRWWTHFFEFHLEVGSPLHRGIDALTTPKLGSKVSSSSYWGSAVTSWQRLSWSVSLPPTLHREAAAAVAVLSEERIQRAPSHALRKGLQVLCSANFLYLHDFWHYKLFLDWEEVEVIVAQCEGERAQALCSTHLVRAAVKFVQEDCESTIPHQLAAMRLRRWRDDGDQPRVGEWWGELDSQLAGKVVGVEDVDINDMEDPRYCECTHGDKLTIHPISVSGGCCSLDTVNTNSESVVCSCECSELKTSSGYSNGCMNSTALAPHWLTGIYGITALHRKIIG